MSLIKHRRCRGISTVEAALVMPLILLLTFGLIEYGSLLLRLQQGENGTRQAARTASTADATSAQVIAFIYKMMTDAGLKNSGYTVTFTPSDVGAVPKGTQLKVSIQLPYQSIAITNAPLIPVPNTIGRTVIMAKEGP